MAQSRIPWQLLLAILLLAGLAGLSASAKPSQAGTPGDYSEWRTFDVNSTPASN